MARRRRVPSRPPPRSSGCASRTTSTTSSASDAELGVVVAYGRIIRPHVLAALPMINVHFSLLPRWRGAAPVERALLAGDTVTGVDIMAVEAALDSGADLRPAHGADRRTDDGRRPPGGARRGRDRPVDRDAVRPAARSAAAGGRADDGGQDRPRRAAPRLVAPGRRARPLGARRRGVDDVPRPSPQGRRGEPGATRSTRHPVCSPTTTAPSATGDGALRLITVQPEGRAPMAWRDFANGAHPEPGEPFV